MKTIFTLFASLIMSMAVLAAPAGNGSRPKSVLTIRSFDRNDIRVVIDGRRFEPNDNYLRVQGIEAGSHDIKIYKERNGGFYSIFGRRYEMVFNNCIVIRPRTDVMIGVDRFGKTTVNESRSRGRFDWNFGDRDDRGFGDRDDRNWDSNHDFSYDRSSNKGDYDKDRDGKWSGNDDRDHHDGRYDDKSGDYDTHYGYAGGMNDREFNQLLQDISKEWLESNKLKSATQIVTTNNLSSAQVKQMVLLFNFESNKLDLAKQAYRNTVDKKNYFMINDVFSFSSSKDDLARFIRNSH